jgi:hypothetical protein
MSLLEIRNQIQEKGPYIRFWHGAMHGVEPTIRPEEQILAGLHKFGFQEEQIAHFYTSFKSKNFPHGVLEPIAAKWDEIRYLHTDKYPKAFEPAYALLTNGLSEPVFNADTIWTFAKNEAAAKGFTTITDTYGYDGAANGLGQIIQGFALAQLDIAQLDRAGREVQF